MAPSVSGESEINQTIYEEYDVETDPSMGTATLEEEEYLDFLEQYGHIDFTLLDFLPKLKSVNELQEEKKSKLLQSEMMIRTSNLL